MIGPFFTIAKLLAVSSNDLLGSSALVPHQKALDTAVEYLQRYGYLNHIGENPTREELEGSVRQAQAILGVTEDGAIGDQTINAILTTPRCAVPDHLSVNSSLARWARSKANGLTYHIVKYVNGLSVDEQEEIWADAFRAWEINGGVRAIRMRSNAADVIISASSDTREEFGRPGQVLAWAQLPGSDNWTGQLLLKADLAEPWSNGLVNGKIDFCRVIKHELGHIFGLDHSRLKSALMYPTYSDTIDNPTQADDIPRFQALYGLPLDWSQPTPSPSDPSAILNRIQVSVDGKAYKLTPV